MSALLTVASLILVGYLSVLTVKYEVGVNSKYFKKDVPRNLYGLLSNFNSLPHASQVQILLATICILLVLVLAVG